ncbi:MAG: hypothetical protein M3530_08155 [Thermoproteota archaeon]|nr:hypothetical protein [Thermoproteota archaeon]
MKSNSILLGLSALFSVCMMMPNVDIGAQVYAQGSTTISTNSSNATTAAKNDRINLQVEELSLSKSPTNLLDVAGKIRNNNTVSVNDVKVLAVYFDKNGAVLGKSDKFVSTQSFLLKPGDVMPFQLLDVFSFDRVGKYNMTAFGDVAP